MKQRAREVTRIIDAIRSGDEGAEARLISLVYDELRQIAASKLAREAPGQTLPPTALVHEAYIRLTANQKEAWECRAHFFAAAAEAMRRILIDRARSKKSVKHGGDHNRVPLDAIETPQANQPEIQALSEALEELEQRDPRAAQVVKLRYFVGLSVDEVAGILGVSLRTVHNDWTISKVWLKKHLS